MKLWQTLYQQVVKVFGDGYKDSMEENGTYSASGVLWDYLWRSVGGFSDGGGVGKADGSGRDRLCTWFEMWK